MSSEYSVVFVTCPASAARKIAKKVLDKRAAACANIVPGIDSMYWWNGKLESAKECLLVMKTRTTALGRLETLVRSAHPYKVPEIIAVQISRGSKPYLDWIGKEARAGR